MGLHRCQPDSMSPIERETRKRIFWALYTMESYVVAILGLPLIIPEEDIDQEMPLEIDDEYITYKDILPAPAGHISLIAGFNAHIELGRILRKVTTDVYPPRGTQKDSQRPRAYVVNDAKVRNIENLLQQWHKNLSPNLIRCANTPQDLWRYK